MIGRPEPGHQPSEDPAVAEVEEILSRAAPASLSPQPASTVRAVAARHALWICACITIDESPTWLIYETGDGRITWFRVPDGVEPSDLLEARSIAGGHSNPTDVVDWLRGRSSDPWGSLGEGSGDLGVLDALRSRITKTTD